MCIGWIMNDAICWSSAIDIKPLTVFCIVFKSIGYIKYTASNQLLAQNAWFFYPDFPAKMACNYCNYFCILSTMKKQTGRLFNSDHWRVRSWNKNIHHFSVPHELFSPSQTCNRLYLSRKKLDKWFTLSSPFCFVVHFVIFP